MADGCPAVTAVRNRKTHNQMWWASQAQLAESANPFCLEDFYTEAAANLCEAEWEAEVDETVSDDSTDLYIDEESCADSQGSTVDTLLHHEQLLPCRIKGCADSPQPTGLPRRPAGGAYAKAKSLAARMSAGLKTLRSRSSTSRQKKADKIIEYKSESPDAEMMYAAYAPAGCTVDGEKKQKKLTRRVSIPRFEVFGFGK